MYEAGPGLIRDNYELAVSIVKVLLPAYISIWDNPKMGAGILCELQQMSVNKTPFGNMGTDYKIVDEMVAYLEHKFSTSEGGNTEVSPAPDWYKLGYGQK